METPETPRTPRVDTSWTPTEDYEISDGGKTIQKLTFGYEQGIVTEQTVSVGASSWTFTINKTQYEDSHMFLGVADTLDDMAWAFSPTTGSLYLHADRDRWGKETRTRIMAGDALFGRQAGSAVQVFVDMVNRTLAFQVHPAGADEPCDIVELTHKVHTPTYVGSIWVCLDSCMCHGRTASFPRLSSRGLCSVIRENRSQSRISPSSFDYWTESSGELTLS